MHRVLRFGRVFAALFLLAAVVPASYRNVAAWGAPYPKFDRILQQRARLAHGRSRVIIELTDAGSLPSVAAVVRGSGGAVGRRLPKIAGQVALVPNALLARIAANPAVRHISLDRRLTGTMERTGATVGATAVRQELGYDGAGVGVALIDSGVTSWHDDLTDAGGAQRVDRFVDFVNGRDQPYDDYGHGTHVAGIVAGNGYDSGGARSGIAPAARLIVLKVLDGAGNGYTSDVIAAIDYAIDHQAELNIRAINLSVAAAVYDSYNSDPLALAAQRAVTAGIVVVAAAGNAGHSADGSTLYGGITAPGNAPWVLTVGASSHMGTIDRSDDTIATFSSRGPGAIDAGAKPDLVAPGVGIESISNPDSSLYTSMSAYLLNGTVWTSYLPYLSLSGTSMAAPVVTGTVALMLQANPALTPNEVKAILEYTAERHTENDPLTQGAGYLNAEGAVKLACYLGDPANVAYPDSTGWSGGFIWGNRLATGGQIAPDANAWAPDVVWGSPATSSGDTVQWGVVCSTADCTTTDPWTAAADLPNVVWGSACGGADCTTRWTLDTVAAALDGEVVVWGTGDSAAVVVWGTNDGEVVVWGTDGAEVVVWGTSCSDPSCTPVIWERP